MVAAVKIATGSINVNYYGSVRCVEYYAQKGVYRSQILVCRERFNLQREVQQENASDLSRC